MVEDVADHPHEIEMHLLGDQEPLQQRGVMHMHARPFQNVDAAVPVPPRWRVYEAGSIEPVVDTSPPTRQVAVADTIRHPTEGVGVGWVGIVKNRREVLAGLQVRHPY